MKPFANILLAAFTTLTLASALAAPQDAAIAEAKKVQAAAVSDAADAPAAKKYPLDHGPRAEVTPWVNEQRRLQDQQSAQLAAAHRASDKHAAAD
jgi:hypothetical protein